jgi:hypothetical protein
MQSRRDGRSFIAAEFGRSDRALARWTKGLEVTYILGLAPICWNLLSVVEPRAVKSSVRSSLGIDKVCPLVYSRGQIVNLLRGANALPPHVGVEI